MSGTLAAGEVVIIVARVDPLFDPDDVFGPKPLRQDIAGDRDEPVMKIGPEPRVLQVRIHPGKR